jgi:uncharacterized membrane protein
MTNGSLNAAKEWMAARRNRVVPLGIFLGGCVIVLFVLVFAVMPVASTPFAVDEVEYSSGFLVPYYLLVALPLAALFPLLWYLLFVKKIKTATLFLIAALTLGILNMAVYPPLSSYDETHHLPATYQLSNRLLGADWKIAEDGARVFEQRADDSTRGLLPTTPTIAQYYYVYTHFFDGEQAPGDTTYLDIVYSGKFYQYTPQVLGVTLGRLLGFGQIATMYLGRLFSLLFYVGVCYLTIRVVPFKTLYTLCALVPALLSLSGSFSYDTVINAGCFFFTGYTFYIAYAKDRFTWKDRLLLIATGALLAPLKYIYIPLLFLPLIIPKEKWGGARAKIFGGVAILLVIGASVSVGSGALLRYFDRNLVDAVSTTPWAQEGYTYNLVFTNPAEVIRLLFATGLDQIAELPHAITNIHMTDMPAWVSYAVVGLIILSVATQAQKKEVVVTRGQKILMGVLALLTYGLGMVAAIPWTAVGSRYIAGAQGRYFFPLYPLLALLASGVLSRLKIRDASLLLAICVINGLCVLYLFQTVILQTPVAWLPN